MSACTRSSSDGKRVEALHADACQGVAGNKRAGKAQRPVSRRSPRSRVGASFTK